jgi:magnesium-transporting ATPase (P-type)
MTGDGINDASSLKSADVGFAMGSGTDVAKEASDIVISDNNFASVVKAILYGRTIFESIRKFIVFQLTMNLGAVGISLIGPFIGIENPVTISQMLWINIIMDTLGALAFASEPSERAFMLQKPKSRDEKIISKPMLSKIIANGIFILLLCVWFLKSDTVSMILMRGDEKYLLSAFFCMFIFMGIFVCFTSRTSRLNLLSHIRENKSFIFIMLLISVMQMGFVYFGGDIFRAVPLKAHDLLCIIAISSSVVAFDFIRKIFANFKSYKSKRANKFLVKKKQIGGKTNVTK